MSEDNYIKALEAARSNFFVNDKEINKLVEKKNKRVLTATEATKRLKKLVLNANKAPLTSNHNLSSNSDWKDLIETIHLSEEKANKRAKVQYLSGVISLPLSLSLALFSLLTGWHTTAGASFVAAIIGAAILAFTVYSFSLLRLQQQASLAAERLAEKRLGLMFVDLALSEGMKDKSEALLGAGTAMFLGHHAPSTIPLSHEDISAVSQIVGAKL